MADVIDKGNYYLRSHNLFLFVSLIAVSSAVSESVFAAA